MISDLLKTRYLISIAECLDPEDFDKLDELHSKATEDGEVCEEIDKMYNKYRNSTDTTEVVS